MNTAKTPPTQGICPQGFAATRFGFDTPLDTNAEFMLGNAGEALAGTPVNTGVLPAVRHVEPVAANAADK